LGWNTDTSDGNWDDQENWFFGMLPDASSDIVIDSNTNINIQGPSAPTELNSLNIGSGSGVVQLTLGSGSITTIDGMLISENGIVLGAGLLGGALDNQGRIELDDNALLELSGEVVNHGVISLGVASQLVLSGLLSGAGIIDGAEGLTVVNGMLSPGNSPGLLSVEGSMNLANSSHTLLELAGVIRGDSFDAIDVGDTLTLGGELEIVLLDDFNPQAGDSFLLLQAAQLQGQFDTINLPQVEGLTFQVDTTQTSLTLVAQAETSEESSPSSGSGSVSWLLLYSVLGVLLSMRVNSRKTVV